MGDSDWMFRLSSMIWMAGICKYPTDFLQSGPLTPQSVLSDSYGYVPVSSAQNKVVEAREVGIGVRRALWLFSVRV